MSSSTQTGKAKRPDVNARINARTNLVEQCVKCALPGRLALSGRRSSETCLLTIWSVRFLVRLRSSSESSLLVNEVLLHCLRRREVAAPRSVLERAAFFTPRGCHCPLLLLLLLLLFLSHRKPVDDRRKGRHRCSSSIIDPTSTCCSFVAVPFCNSCSPFALGMSFLGLLCLHPILPMTFSVSNPSTNAGSANRPTLDCLSLASLSFVVKM